MDMNIGTMDLFQLLIDRGSQHYRNESGHDPEDIFSEDRAADLLCDKLFCQHAVQLYCHFCGTACHRLWLQFYGMPVFTFDYGHRVYFCIGTGTDHFGMHGVSEGSRAYTWYCVYGMDVYVAGGISAFLHSEEAAVDFPVKSDGTDHYSVS